MDILYQISYLLHEDLDKRRETDPEYRFIQNIEKSLLETLTSLAGEELVGKLLDAQEERMEADRLFSFLCGLRLGVALLDLQG